MARKQIDKLKWCKVRFGNDSNWWVYETSDKVNWDYDGLSVLDPRQSSHLVETLQSIKEYGLEESIVEKAFLTFIIDSQDGNDGIKLQRTNETVMDPSEQIFLFPDTLDDEKSNFAEFLNHITSLQIKMLNSSFDFEEDLTIEDLEEQLRDKFHSDYMEGKAIHAFYEIMDILEYIPEGYSLEDDEMEEPSNDEEKEYDEIEDLPEEEETLIEDETMQWEDSEDEEEDYRSMDSMSFDEEDDDRY